MGSSRILTAEQLCDNMILRSWESVRFGRLLLAAPSSYFSSVEIRARMHRCFELSNSQSCKVLQLSPKELKRNLDRSEGFIRSVEQQLSLLHNPHRQVLQAFFDGASVVDMAAERGIDEREMLTRLQAAYVALRHQCERAGVV